MFSFGDATDRSSELEGWRVGGVGRGSLDRAGVRSWSDRSPSATTPPQRAASAPATNVLVLWLMEMRDRASRGGMAAYVRRLINHCVHATPGGARLSRAPQRPLHTALLIDLAARQGLSAAELESLIDNPARCVSEALHYLLQAAQEEAGTDDSRGTDAPSAAADRQDSNDNSPGWSIPGHFSVETVDLDAELDAEIRAHRRRNSSRG